MFRAVLCRALPLAFVALSTTSVVAFAADPAAADPASVMDPAAVMDPAVVTDPAAVTDPTNGSAAGSVLTIAGVDTQAAMVPTDAEHWTAYGFNVTAPATLWPMLELLHKQKFDWELASAGQRPTPLVWETLPPGVYGQYVPSLNVVKVSWVLQNSSVEVATAFLAHELTHLNDDLNGRLGNMSSSACYATESRAFVNEANFWQMVVGPRGKTTNDPIETEENAKMFAFVGNSQFADLVVRTTPSYVKQCGT